MQPLVAQQNKAPELEDVLGYHLRRASNLSLASFARALGDEIKPIPFTVLCVIEEQPGVTAAEIGRQLSLQRANLAPMLAELEGRGLIERRADRGDHRVHRLHASPEGAAALADWRARVLAEEDKTLHALSPAERATLRALLVKVWKRD